MLIVGRKKNEKIIINGDIEIIVLDIWKNHVRLGINAPRNIVIETRLKTSPDSELKRANDVPDVD